jgi:hypothetical protein
MDLENPACKEALGTVPLVIHEETRAKPVPKQLSVTFKNVIVNLTQDWC